MGIPKMSASAIKRRATITSLAMIGFGLPAVAQDTTEICGADLIAEQIVGTYTLSVGNALLFAEGRAVPLKDNQSMSATISEIDGNLELESDGFSLSLQIVDADYKPDWNWDPMEGIMALSSEEFSLVFDCPVIKFPRLIGQGSVITEGVKFVSNYYLVIYEINENGAEMFGALQGEGGGISVKRAVQLKTQ